MAGRSWNEYRELVLHELERFQKWLEDLTEKAGTQKEDIEGKIDALRSEVGKIRNDVTALKVKMAFIAVIAGAVPGIVMWAIEYFT